MENIAAVLAALGGFELIKYLTNLVVNRRNNRRKADADADKAETAADAERIKSYIDRIDELNRANKMLHEQNIELLKAGAKKEEIITDKDAHIRKIAEERVAEARRAGDLEKKLTYYQGWKCFREFGSGAEECDRRKPKQNPPLKYTPIDEENS